VISFNIGEDFEICGHTFKVVGLELRLGKPPKATIVSPMELLEVEHQDGTDVVSKVIEVLMIHGSTPNDAQGLVRSMQNAGIVFNERS
jgi:hypothetical protein